MCVPPRWNSAFRPGFQCIDQFLPTRQLKNELLAAVKFYDTGPQLRPVILVQPAGNGNRTKRHLLRGQDILFRHFRASLNLFYQMRYRTLAALNLDDCQPEGIHAFLNDNEVIAMFLPLNLTRSLMPFQLIQIYN